MKTLPIHTLRTMKHVAVQVRNNILTMAYRAQSAHAGGAYSCVEILVCLCWYGLRIDPKNPTDLQKDRCIFSKGHDVKALYGVLARRGFWMSLY
ncbi:MAG: hypothetical protein N3A54_06730 [Patescibacteria group bacterium]|nr:hypothetical protein [Patescibacteria group bacterium]